MLFLLAYILADRRLIDDLEKGNSSFKWPSLFFVAILWLKFKPHMLTPPDTQWLLSLSLYLHLKKISRKEWAPDWYRDFFMSLPLLYLPFLINTPHIPQQLANSACCYTNTTIICYWKDSMKSVCRQISNRTTNNASQQSCPWHQ